MLELARIAECGGLSPAFAQPRGWADGILLSSDSNEYPLIFREHRQAERDIPQGSLLTLRWREADSNHRSLSYDEYPNGLKKEPELCAHGQPRRNRYPDNRMVRRGPTLCPNALPKPYASQVRLVGRMLCSIAL